MVVTTTSYTTGPSTLQDVGTLQYNGCLFSPLYETTVSGTIVKDAAGRTTKWMEYLITADGYVTLPVSATSITGTMDVMRGLLTAQGGALVYKGRGCDIVVNPAGALANSVIAAYDLAWGPVPELLEFQPLGGGLSAKIRWQVKVRISELIPNTDATTKAGLANLPLLQFNYETVVSYAEDGYSSMSVKGTVEIPMTRVPSQKTRTLSFTADDVRGILDTKIFTGIDLSLFRVTKRDYNVSRDKRTMEFDVGVEETPYMGLPPNCTLARGNFSVRPSKQGAGLCNWLCTLRGTYTVRGDGARRLAWFSFLNLLRLRMAYAAFANITFKGNQNPGIGILPRKQELVGAKRAWLIDFSVDEGLYLDSKTVGFSATWRLITTFSHILLASGLWRKLDEVDGTGKNLWATSMKDVQGSKSWLENEIDPSMDIIVDFGGG